MVLIKYYKYDVLLLLSRQAGSDLVICGQIPDMGPHAITRLLYVSFYA